MAQKSKDKFVKANEFQQIRASIIADVNDLVVSKVEELLSKEKQMMVQQQKQATEKQAQLEQAVQSSTSNMERLKADNEELKQQLHAILRQLEHGVYPAVVQQPTRAPELDLESTFAPSFSVSEAVPKPKPDIKPVAAPKPEEKKQEEETAAVASSYEKPAPAAAAPVQVASMASDDRMDEKKGEKRKAERLLPGRAVRKEPVGSIKWQVLRDASLETWDSGSLGSLRPKRLATVRAGTIVHAHSSPEMHHGKMRVRVSVHDLVGWLSLNHDTADKEPVANYRSGTAFTGYSSCGREGTIVEPCE